MNLKFCSSATLTLGLLFFAQAGANAKHCFTFDLVSFPDGLCEKVCFDEKTSQFEFMQKGKKTPAALPYSGAKLIAYSNVVVLPGETLATIPTESDSDSAIYVFQNGPFKAAVIIGVDGKLRGYRADSAQNEEKIEVAMQAWKRGHMDKFVSGNLKLDSDREDADSAQANEASVIPASSDTESNPSPKKWSDSEFVHLQNMIDRAALRSPLTDPELHQSRDFLVSWWKTLLSPTRHSSGGVLREPLLKFYQQMSEINRQAFFNKYPEIFERALVDLPTGTFSEEFLANLGKMVLMKNDAIEKPLARHISASQKPHPEFSAFAQAWFYTNDLDFQKYALLILQRVDQSAYLRCQAHLAAKTGTDLDELQRAIKDAPAN